jgi:hypothetical protein
MMSSRIGFTLALVGLLDACGGMPSSGQCGRDGRSGGVSCGYGKLQCSAGQHCSSAGSCADGCQSDENCGPAEYCHKEILCGLPESVGTCIACDRKVACMPGGPPPPGSDPLMQCTRNSNLDSFCGGSRPPRGYDCPSSVDPSASGCVLKIGTVWCCG